MTITRLMLGRRARQFENDDPKGKVIALKWMLIFAVGNAYYQTDMLWPTEDLPERSDVQQHIEAHPDTVQAIIATSGPRGIGFTFLTGKNDRILK